MRPNLANEVKPANHPFRGIRIAASGLALALAAACFQPAGNSLEPTSVDLAEVTRIAPAATLAPSPTPFITPLPPEGFIPPTLPPEVTATFLPTETSLPMADLYSPTPTLSFGDSSALTPSPETPLLPPTPTALPTDNPCIHTVQPGEWMNKIARQYNISLQDLIALTRSSQDAPIRSNPVINYVFQTATQQACKFPQRRQCQRFSQPHQRPSLPQRLIRVNFRHLFRSLIVYIR